MKYTTPLVIALAASLSRLGIAASPALPSSAVPDGLGVNIHFTDPRPGEMEQLTAAGFRWVRMDFHWEGTEKERGKYDFSAYERLLTALDAHHIHALFILDYGNKLYEPLAAVTTDEGRAAFARWAAAATTHFKGRGVIWEIWNEPNGGFWKPKANVEQYAAAALAASKAIREATPSELLVGPATSGVDMKFLESCFQAGLLTYWDAVSVHPYRQAGPETAEKDYHDLRKMIDQYAPKGRKIPILSGEWGYSSGWKNFDPAKQGKFLPREWLTNLAHGIPVSIWYDWHDDGKDPKEPEHHFGTTENEYHAGRDPVYDPKPAYIAAKTLTSNLEGFRFVKRLAAGGADDYAMLFANGDKLRLAVWTVATEPHEIRLPSAAGDFEVVSHLGEKLAPITASKGFLTIPATDAPVYVIAKGPNPPLANAPIAHPLRATILPPAGASMAVRVENLTEAGFNGSVRLINPQGIELAETQRPVAFADGEFEKTVSFPIRKLPAGEYSTGLRVEESSGPALELAPKTYRLLSNEILSGCKAFADGDAKVTSEQSLAVGPAEPPIANSPAEALKISYRFGEGWKFIRVVPQQQEIRAIAGEPKAFGFWIYGNGQGISPRLRVTDTTHQTWQPGGEAINWKGWRYVQFDLKPSTAHWGGANDGVIHYPLEWDSLILIDNVGKKQNEGSVQIAGPVLVY